MLSKFFWDKVSFGIVKNELKQIKNNPVTLLEKLMTILPLKTARVNVSLKVKVDSEYT